MQKPFLKCTFKRILTCTLFMMSSGAFALGATGFISAAPVATKVIKEFHQFIASDGPEVNPGLIPAPATSNELRLRWKTAPNGLLC